MQTQSSMKFRQISFLRVIKGFSVKDQTTCNLLSQTKLLFKTKYERIPSTFNFVYLGSLYTERRKLQI